jgi:hypothetical protein
VNETTLGLSLIATLLLPAVTEAIDPVPMAHQTASCRLHDCKSRLAVSTAISPWTVTVVSLGLPRL